MSRKPVIPLFILELLAHCGCLSKQTIDLLPFSYNSTMIALSSLLAQEAIRKHGKGANKYYTLLDAGKQMLTAHDPVRYSPDKFPSSSTINRHPERAKVCGDAQAFLALSGFRAHPDDKPGLPADCASPLDAGQPFNFYYDSTEIKRYFIGKNDNGLRYSRATGVALTPDNLFRVYHTRDVAMEIHLNGENKLQSLLPRLFQNYTVQGNPVLVLGDNSFESAEKIIRNSSPESKKRWRHVKDQEHRGEMLDVSNLGSPLHFVPLDANMQPLLRMLRHPGGWSFMRECIVAYLGGVRDKGYGIYEVVLDGLPNYFAFTLNLTALRSLLSHVDHSKSPVAVVCAEWQEYSLKDIAALT